MKKSDNCDGFDDPTTTRRNVLLTLSASVGLSAVGPSAVRGSAAAATDRVDARTLALTDEWRTVSHSVELEDPVVVATPLSYRGQNEASTRIDGIGPAGFDAAVEEWAYRDGTHLEESVGSLAVGAGAVRFDDGPLILAGTVSAGSEWTRAAFDGGFSNPPIVLTGTQTRNVSRPVVTRNRDVSTDGVSVRVQSGESSSVETTETVGFVAVERGSGTLGADQFEAGVVAGVKHSWQTVEFDGEYADPVFLADMQTTDGPDTATLRYRNLGPESVEVFVQEELSEDDERTHAEEIVGYLVVEGDSGTGDSPTDGSETDGYGAGGYGMGPAGA